MDRLKECQIYIKKWYMGEPVITVRLSAGTVLNNLCMQAMVVELLRDLIDNPIPDRFIEGSMEFNVWIDAGLKRVMEGLNFGFNVDECGAIKNLAWNFWAEGIRKTLADPKLQDRIFKCSRGELEQWGSRKETRH